MLQLYYFFAYILCFVIINTMAIHAKSIKATSLQERQYINLSLNNAIKRGLEYSPLLQALTKDIAIAHSQLKQAGLQTNPEIGMQIENIAGSNNYGGVEAVQTTYDIAQEYQLKDKINARRNIALKGIKAVNLAYQITALDIIQNIEMAYIQAMAIQKNLDLLTEQKKLAENVFNSVTVRVDAAASPLLEKNRAKVEFYNANMLVETAVKEHESALKKLGALIGLNKFLLSNRDVLGFYQVKKPNINSNKPNIESSPDLTKFDATYQQSQAQLELEKANATPNPTFNFGIRDARFDNSQAFVMGISLPITVFDNNRNNIDKARYVLEKVEKEKENTKIIVENNLTQAEISLKNAFNQMTLLKSDMLPTAQKALKLAQEGYELGRFSYLDVLDASRSLISVKQQYILAARDFHLAQAAIKRLTAIHIDKVLLKDNHHAQ